jgi:pimeloyl-ACP methyl ester carboxylesterase
MPIAKILSENRQVFIPQLRGHGDSQRFSSYSMPDFLGDLHQVIAACTEGTCALFGHSLGGHIASRYSALFPDQVRALILVEGLGPPGKAPQNEGDEILAYKNALVSRILQARKQTKPIKNKKYAIERLMMNNPRMTATLATQIAEYLTVYVQGKLRWNFDPKANGVFVGTSYQENARFWRQIKSPTCIVSGLLSYEYWDKEFASGDKYRHFKEGEMESRTREFKNAQHHWFEESGHMVHYDEPDRLAKLCNTFLEEKYE